MNNSQLYEQSAIQISGKYGVPANIALSLLNTEGGMTIDENDPIRSITDNVKQLKKSLELNQGDEILGVTAYLVGNNKKIPNVQNVVSNVLANSQKYIIQEPPATDIWNLPADAKPSMDVPVPLRPNGEIEPPKMNIKPFNPSAVSTSGNMELEAMLQRTIGFLDKNLASYNGNYWSKNAHDQYWDNFADNYGFGMTGYDVRREASKLLVGLAQSMGGNLLEPQFWYEHGLMAEYVDYMPQIFAMKRQELNSGKTARDQSLLERLKIDLVENTPQGINLDPYAELGRQKILDAMFEVSKAYGNVNGRDTIYRLYSNSDFLNAKGFGDLALIGENRLKLQENQRHFSEQIDQAFKGENLPDVAEGQMPISFLGGAGGNNGNPPLVPKDAVETAIQIGLLSKGSTLSASGIANLLNSSPFIKPKDRQEFIRRNILDAIERVGMQPITTDKDLNELSSKLQQLADPELWTQLVSPEYFEMSKVDIQKKLNEASVKLNAAEVERKKGVALPKVLESIDRGDADLYDIQTSTLKLLGMSIDDIGDKYVIVKAGGTENVSALLQNINGFRDVVTKLAKFNIKSPIVSRFIQGVMPTSNDDAKTIDVNMEKAFAYYQAIDGDKSLFVNKTAHNMFRLYEEVGDLNINKDVFATIYRKYNNQELPQSKMLAELTANKMDKDVMKDFSTFVNDFLQADDFFGIDRVESGARPRLMKDGTISNMDRRDMQKIFDVWQDTYVLHKYAESPNPIYYANKAVKENLGVFYNDPDEWFKDRPSIIPVRYTGDGAKEINDNLNEVRAELTKTDSIYKGFWSSNPQLTVVWDWSGTGNEYEIYEERPDGEMRMVRRVNADNNQVVAKFNDKINTAMINEFGNLSTSSPIQVIVGARIESNMSQPRPREMRTLAMEVGKPITTLESESKVSR